MESEKRGSPETSSEETDQQTESTRKRSYECSFCKRGFTNAQALGGHMNIHRKDRAKAKILSPARAHAPSIPSEPSRYYQACVQAPDPSPNPGLLPQFGYYTRDHFLGAASLRMNEELLGANLSLGIGPAGVGGNDLMNKYMMKEDEIDLELRLGHHP